MNSDKNDRQQLVNYADEVLHANWQPLALMLAEPLACAQQTAFDAGNVEDFLARLYVSQHA